MPIGVMMSSFAFFFFEASSSAFFFVSSLLETSSLFFALATLLFSGAGFPSCRALSGFQQLASVLLSVGVFVIAELSDHSPYQARHPPHPPLKPNVHLPGPGAPDLGSAELPAVAQSASNKESPWWIGT